MDKINKFIDSLEPLEKFALKTEVIKRFHMEPEYTVVHDKDGYHTKSNYPILDSCIFENADMANLAYWIRKNITGTGESILHVIKFVFRVLNLKSEWTK